MLFDMRMADNNLRTDMRQQIAHPQSSLGRRISKLDMVDSTPSLDQLSITLGLELEFILAVSTYPEKASEENIDSECAQDIVRYALTQPVVAKCATCAIEHAFELLVHPTCERDNQYWTVEEDTSLMILDDELETLGEAEKYFHFYAIEVKSRILRPGMNFDTTHGDRGTDHVHEITYVQEIDAVLERLHDFFTGPTRGHKINGTHIVLNSTSGLHIHVGNEQRGFPLSTVKKILSTYVANERAIDSLHAASRIGGSSIAMETLKEPYYNRNLYELNLLPLAYSTSWSTLFAQTAHTLKRQRLGYNTKPSCLPRPYDGPPEYYPETHMEDQSVGDAVDSFYVGDWLEVIDHAPNLQALQQLQLSSLGRGTVNLRNLGPYESEKEKGDFFPFSVPQLMTIEFRQHAGSLDSAEIRAWMDFVVSMVTHAHNTSGADYKVLSRIAWLQPNHGSIDLLNALSCSLDTKRFYQSKLAMSSELNADMFAAYLAKFDLFPADVMIVRLLECVERKRRQDNDPGNVAARIKEKFRMGGYGKFSDEYLNELVDFDLYDPHLGLRDKLSIDGERCC